MSSDLQYHVVHFVYNLKEIIQSIHGIDCELDYLVKQSNFITYTALNLRHNGPFHTSS